MNKYKMVKEVGQTVSIDMKISEIDLDDQCLTVGLYLGTQEVWLSVEEALEQGIVELELVPEIVKIKCPVCEEFRACYVCMGAGTITGELA